MCWAGLLLFKCYRRWIGGHPQQMNEGRYPHRGKPQTIMIHCVAANRKHAFVSVAHMLRCDQTHTIWNSVPTPPVRSTPEVNSGGTDSSMVQSKDIAISKTQLQDVIAGIDASRQSADNASRLAIAAAQAFAGEREKLEIYSGLLSEFLERK